MELIYIVKAGSMIMSRLIILIILIAIILQEVKGFVFIQYSGGHCLLGNSMGTVTVENSVACGFECKRVPWCTSYNFFEFNKTCDMKHPVSSLSLYSSPTNVPGCKFFYQVEFLLLMRR